MASMQGTVIAVTGAASGIGLATSKVLASRGAILSLADNRAEPLQAAAESIASTYGVEVMTTTIDVRQRQECEEWIKKTVDKFGRLDGAANLAGVIGPSMGKKTIAEFDDDAEWEFIMGVNVTGIFNCLRAELKVMTSGGAIVNASSVAGLTGNMRGAPYAASKHAVIGLTRTAAKESGSQNIRVNAVAPGYVATPMSDTLEVQRGSLPVGMAALGRKGDPAEVGQLIAFLLSRESSFITGSVYTIDGGWLC